jgi:hypothetical protein
LLPGRTYSSEELEAKLRDHDLEMIKIRPWQEDYDLVRALKPGVCTPVAPRKLESVLRCPICAAAVTRDGNAFHCAQGHVIPIADDGIVEMVNAAG